ncbi:MAG: hypothetical protein HYZ53_17065 [Planctomycetes bacterium]|nr:hypothetical protein [Planctomycetota bacterium]
MAELHQKYADQGFHIIGLECQGSSKDEISRLAQSKGVKFQLTTGGELKGAHVTGIPHGFLFGPDGRLAADNPHGAELESKVKELLGETFAAMVGPGPYKKLASLASQVRAGKNLGQVLKTLRAKLSSKDPEEAAEAKMMFDSLNGAATRQMEGAMARKASDPVACVKTLDVLAARFKDDEVGSQAKKELDVQRKDPAVKKEMDASAVLAKVQALIAGLKPVQGDRDPGSGQFRKKNAEGFQQVVAGCKFILQKFPDTQAAAEARTLLEQYQ